MTDTPTEEPTSTTTPADSEPATDSSGSTGGSSDSSSSSSGGSSGGDDDSGDISLDTQGSTVFLQAGAFAPGDTATGTVDVRNSGSSAGALGISNASVTDDENGVQEPEQALGDTVTAGELSDHLQVRLWITYADGTQEYIVGSASSTVGMATLDGASERGTRAVAGGDEATLGIEVTLPATAGNEVQSDRVELTVPIVLQAFRS